MVTEPTSCMLLADMRAARTRAVSGAAGAEAGAGAAAGAGAEPPQPAAARVMPSARTPVSALVTRANDKINAISCSGMAPWCRESSSEQAPSGSV
jgi:hypothetical protein